jgi:Bacterial alpha-L-rhamnosidase 6 hairpin glycosidase domain
MLKRRDFLKTAAAAATAAVVSRRTLGMNTTDDEGALHFSSESLDVQFSATAPELLSLNIDGLGKGRRGPSSLDVSKPATGFKVLTKKQRDGLRVDYRAATADTQSSWTFTISSNKLMLTSQWVDGVEPVPMTFHFNLNQVHSTVLGVFGKDKLLATPVLLHFPGQGSMRLTASDPNIGLTYTSNRPHEVAALSLPAATSEQNRINYTLEATAIYPDLPGIVGDERFDAFRRNWLNALQLNPNYPALANNTASDTCAFCYYEFADIAALTPALAEGLTALDVMRQTLDRILGGGMAYGLPGPGMQCCPSAYSDALPAMMIAAANCVRAGGSDAWLAANYEGIRGWAETMLATDTDGDGLFKYSVSGNSGIWKDGAPTFRPSNWWDTIGFGHEDAYGNALAYRALRNMTELANKLGKHADARRYEAAAKKLHGAYYQRFFDPATGVLGGWRSADGQLHDYYFLWVNGIAIHYGLVPKAEANAIMDRLMAKMKEVGYDRFDMGLPGNLITVALKDCVDKRGNGRFGCGTQPDNSDGFQNYENGGATGSFAFFTLAALYDLGRKAEADAILFPMLETYGKYGFEGKDAHGMSPDWRRWDGTSKGYEGYLTDNFYALFAVPLRQHETEWSRGFRTATVLT